MNEIVMGAIAIFLFKLGSRNRLNNKRREKPFVANYEQTFGVRLPHQDTTKDVLRKLSPEKLEQVKMDLMSNMFEYVLEAKLVTRNGYCFSVSTIAHLYSGRRIISLRRGISGL